MNHQIRLVIILMFIWVLLSGMFEPLMLSFGVFSIIFTMWITRRMINVDNERYTFVVSRGYVSFFCKLAIKVVQSNIDVCMRILGFRPVQSTFVTITMPFADDVAKVLYANAITLTPGSSSIALTSDTLLVHTISTQGADDLANDDMLSIMPKQYSVEQTEVFKS